VSGAAVDGVVAGASTRLVSTTASAMAATVFHSLRLQITNKKARRENNG